MVRQRLEREEIKILVGKKHRHYWDMNWSGTGALRQVFWRWFSGTIALALVLVLWCWSSGASALAQAL